MGQKDGKGRLRTAGLPSYCSTHQALGTNSEQLCVGASNDLILDLDLECDILFGCVTRKEAWTTRKVRGKWAKAELGKGLRGRR